MKIEIYLKRTCPYCIKALALLEKKGFPEALLEVTDIGAEPEKRPEMQERSGRNTVPQIFINGQHIGGCDDLHALDAAGGLDKLLK